MIDLALSSWYYSHHATIKITWHDMKGPIRTKLRCGSLSPEAAYIQWEIWGKYDKNILRCSYCFLITLPIKGPKRIQMNAWMIHISILHINTRKTCYVSLVRLYADRDGVCFISYDCLNVWNGIWRSCFDNYYVKLFLQLLVVWMPIWCWPFSGTM